MSSHPQKPLFTVPEQGSIHAILIANPSKRLYAHPLEWKEQLQYLSCQLHATILSPDHEIVTDDTLSCLELENIQDCFFIAQTSSSPTVRLEHMISETARLYKIATGSRPQSLEIAFRYNGHKVAYINLPLAFCNYQSTQNEARAWAYIDSTSLRKERINYHLRRKRSYSRARRAAEAIKAISDPAIDPLFVAILIALAQRTRAGGSNPSERPQEISVSLFFSKHILRSNPQNAQNDTGRKSHSPLVISLMQYTATITDEYLQKFDDPLHFHSGTLHIHQTLFSLDSPMTYYQAIKAASHGQILPSTSSTIHPKRKALNDVTETVNKIQRTERVSEEENKK